MTANSPTHSWLATGFLLGAAMTLGILMFVPKNEADNLAYSALVLGLILAISSLAAFLIIEIRKLIAKGPATEQVINSSLRQGIELSLLIIGFMWLYRYDLLTWWDGVLLFITVALSDAALGFKKSPKVG